MGGGSAGVRRGRSQVEPDANAKGVDQAGVDRCSAIAYAYAQSTFGALRGRDGLRIEGDEESFANVVRIGDARVAVTSDGIGTKLEVAERVGRFDTLGFDLLAMVLDDLAAIGAAPVAVSNIIDADRLDEATIDAMMSGLARAARECGVAVTGGEIAALGRRVGGWGDGPHVNWCATAIGVLPGERPALCGKGLVPGDEVVALRSAGLRSNGFTLARKILEQALGDAWHLALHEGTSWGDLLLTPSLIYAPSVVSALASGVPIRGLAHITGGGIPGNFPRVLRATGLGAELVDLWSPHGWVLRLAELGGLSAREAYAEWNMGNGMLAVVPEGHGRALVQAFEACGRSARVAGRVVPEDGITIDARAWGLGIARFAANGEGDA
ncbi:MAG: AIR synthase-related protein [Candidatus Bipolaricaulota bacterium]|nr:AIR synthase-related protein [Candidatus Bipolaricaulota bacterium]